MNLKYFSIDFFRKGHPRTIKAKKNIIASFGLKGFSILVSFLLVPLTLNYLNPTKYGIWLTISSIIGWFGFFDIGLGNGLRNKLAEAFAVKDYKLAKIYISTTYAILLLIIAGVYLLFLIINPLLNWSKLLNTTPEIAGELSWVAIIVFTFFALRFILKLIGVVLTADQLPAYNNAFGPLGNIIALVGIYFITKFSQGNLLYISVIYSSAPVIILIIASVYFFNGKYNDIKPNINAVNFKYFKPLAGLGLNFFIIQIATLIMFSTDNMIITQVLGPAEVTPYNIAFKYFGIPIMIMVFVITPLWSATTDAYTKGDIVWIKNYIRKMIFIWTAIVILTIILISISSYFYLFWIGKDIKIPFFLTISMGFYSIIINWNYIFVFFLNGVGKIRLQLYNSILVMILNIPLSIVLAKNLNIGSSGVIIATCFCLFIGSLWTPIQYYKIINNKATGIWAK